ncbi:MAG TPA: protein translocase subunit SecF [Gemmatimonadales bacterium]|jgi:preprotein translocase subunit SecF
MRRLFANANYDFIGLRRIAYLLTGLIIIPGMLMVLFKGLNYSIEFTGGTLVQVKARTPAMTVGALRSALDKVGLNGAQISQFGGNDEFVIRARLAASSSTIDEHTAERTRALVDSTLTKTFGANTYTAGRGEAVGPKVGGELRRLALLAILVSFALTMVYLAFRFEWRFGVAATLATAHDILATLAFIMYMRLEVSLIVVSAILTVVGYSLNDTIIIFDRTRENLHKYKRQDLAGILNRSINETLPRSILTHGTALATTLAMLIFAGEVIRPFAWVMAFGIFTGTFSSIYIASPMLLLIEQKWPGKDARGVKARVMPAGPPAGGMPSGLGIQVPSGR